MKLLKIFIVLIIILVGLTASALWLGNGSINAHIKHQVENKLLHVTRVNARLDSVNTQLMDGKIVLSNLLLSNPAGFDSKQLLHIDQVVVEVDIATAFNDVITLKNISLDNAAITLEEKGLGKVNLKTVKDNAENDEPEQDPINALKFKLDKFQMEDGQLTVRSELLGTKTIPLNTVTATNIGAKDNGLPLKELIRAIVQEVIAGTLKQQPATIQQKIREKLETIIDVDAIENKLYELKQRLPGLPSLPKSPPKSPADEPPMLPTPKALPTQPPIPASDTPKKIIL